MKTRLFSAKDQTGTHYEAVLKKEPQVAPYVAKNSKPIGDTLDELYVKWYFKTGLYCKLSPSEFLDQPYLFMVEITKEIDRRMDNWEDEIYSQGHLELLLFGAKLFGKE